jgi:hypothetical protein
MADVLACIAVPLSTTTTTAARPTITTSTITTVLLIESINKVMEAY